MRLSERTSQHDVPNALTEALARARQRERSGGPRVLDLTVSNPTAAQIPYDAGAILTAFGDPQAMRYAPEPLGLASARAAVAADYARSGVAIDPARIALTASTSEAYGVLFKMLCDPGDELLVPAPSYPLLGFLAAFESVRLRPYPLVYAGRWHVDLEGLRAALSPRTRGVVVVNPNNPTGSYLGREELSFMLDLGLPILSDEVFARYPLAAAVPDDRVDTVLRAERGLVFALSGLSKLVGLPQMKLGWIGVGGDPALAAAAMARLELVLDAYLSVGAPVQHALPTILASTTAPDAIRRRVQENLAVVRAACARAPLATVLCAEGGWYAIVRVPETRTDEEWALALLEHDAVHVHPGYFFDMGRGAHLVVSLLTPGDVLAAGMDRLADRLAAEG